MHSPHPSLQFWPDYAFTVGEEKRTPNYVLFMDLAHVTITEFLAGKLRPTQQVAKCRLPVVPDSAQPFFKEGERL
jgi:hypothetical protein